MAQWQATKPPTQNIPRICNKEEEEEERKKKLGPECLVAYWLVHATRRPAPDFNEIEERLSNATRNNPHAPHMLHVAQDIHY